MVLVALDRILVAVLELLLIEVERGCKLLELRVFNYLEALLLFVGVYILAEGFPLPVLPVSGSGVMNSDPALKVEPGRTLSAAAKSSPTYSKVT